MIIIIILMKTIMKVFKKKLKYLDLIDVTKENEELLLQKEKDLILIKEIKN